MIAKEKNIKLGREIYLLGIDSDGKKAYLSAPSWDCDWYWGFGYVSAYNNRRADIFYHIHWDTSIVGANNSKDGDYCTNPFDSKFFKSTAFTQDEGWELAELFKRFYLLKESAAMFEKGSVHISGNSKSLERDSWAKEINKVLIPATTARILEILTPSK